MERFAKVNELLAEYESLEAQMADPSIHADQNKARALGKRYAQLGPVIAGYRAYKLAEEDLIAGKELAESDPSFASEIVCVREDLKMMQQLYWRSYYYLEIQMMIVM